MFGKAQKSISGALKAGAALGLTAMLCGCLGGGGGYSSGSSNGGGGYGGSGGSGGSGNNGTMQVSMTDAPGCGYDHVYVTVQKVSVNQSATAAATDPGWVDIAVTPAQRIDLLTLSNGTMANLGTTSLAAGTYSQLRLVLVTSGSTTPLPNSVVPTGSNEVSLTIPATLQSGIAVSTNLSVAANQTTSAAIDFNACQSIAHGGTSGSYTLKPVISVTTNYASGASGYVNTQLNPALTTVSLQQAGVVVKATMPDATGKFVVEPAAPGTYDLVIASPGHASTVVTGVAVAANSVTSVSTSSAPLTPQGDVDGTLTGFALTGVNPADARVVAQQVLSSGDTITVAALPVDIDTGAYSLVVAAAAPMVASFTAPPAIMNFAADSARAGLYTLVATSGAASKTAVGVKAVAGASTTTNFTFP